MDNKRINGDKRKHPNSGGKSKKRSTKVLNGSRARFW